MQFDSLGFTSNHFKNLIRKTPYENKGKIFSDYALPSVDDQFGLPLQGAKKKLLSSVQGGEKGIGGWLNRVDRTNARDKALSGDIENLQKVEMDNLEKLDKLDYRRAKYEAIQQSNDLLRQLINPYNVNPEVESYYEHDDIPFFDMEDEEVIEPFRSSLSPRIPRPRPRQIEIEEESENEYDEEYFGMTAEQLAKLPDPPSPKPIKIPKEIKSRISGAIGDYNKKQNREEDKISSEKSNLLMIMTRLEMIEKQITNKNVQDAIDYYGDELNKKGSIIPARSTAKAVEASVKARKKRAESSASGSGVTYESIDEAFSPSVPLARSPTRSKLIEEALSFSKPRLVPIKKKDP